MISVNYRDSRPIYVQIADSIKMQIAKQILQPDEKLPSVREIASELTINPNTIQRAYRELEQEGYVYTVSGRGTFVAAFDKENSKRKMELLEEFDEVVKELILYGSKGDELMDRLQSILKEGDK